MTLTVYGDSLQELWSLDGTTTSLIESTPENFALLVDCCCPEVECNCDGITDELDVRIKWYCFGAAAGTGANYDFPAALTLQVGGPADGDPAGCTGGVLKYWKGSINLPCANPDDLEIEVVCCGSTEPPLMLVRYSTDLASGWGTFGGDVDNPCCKWRDDAGVGNYSDSGDNCGNCSPFTSPSGEVVLIKCTTESWSTEDDEFT